MEKKGNGFVLLLKWIKFIADLLDGAQDKYNKHFGPPGQSPVVQSTPQVYEKPTEQIVESPTGDQN